MLTYAPVGIPTATLVAATLAVVVLELVTPITIRQVYNSFIPYQSTESLAVMIFVAITCLGVEVILRSCRALIISRVGAAYGHRAGCHLVGALLDGRMPGAASQGVATKLSLISLVRSFRESGASMQAITLAELVLVPLNMILIGLIAGKLVMLAIALVAGFLLLTALIGRNLLRRREARQASDATRIDLMVEMLGAVSTIKAMSTERIMSERYNHRQYESSLENLKVAQSHTLVFDLTASFSTTLVLCVIFYGAYLTVSAELTLGSMIAAIILTGRTMPPLQRAIGMVNRRQENRLEESKVQAVLAITPGPPRLPREDCPGNLGELSLRKLMLTPLDRAVRGDRGQGCDGRFSAADHDADRRAGPRRHQPLLALSRGAAPGRGGAGAAERRADRPPAGRGAHHPSGLSPGRDRALPRFDHGQPDALRSRAGIGRDVHRPPPGAGRGSPGPVARL
ncbi:MAG: transporter related [Cereibacter sp.]|jgi:ATP-binding cassette subfamily C protein LapB|nr:transporter related [Cereibacter sp.]